MSNTSFHNVFDAAIELFEGDRDKALRWLNTENKNLHTTPFEKMRTKRGRAEVKKLIGRLEHGVFQ